ncbi:MAG TPA: hypothetical protein VFP54_11155 [Acidimicrobiales bacterium]|nr:hypothetical protein [Acidimicrobiales bacterium]
MRWWQRTRSHEAWELADWQPDEWEYEDDGDMTPASRSSEG